MSRPMNAHVHPIFQPILAAMTQPPLKKRHAPKLEVGRCCWICGRVGGGGFTTALRLLGYDVKRGEIAYAHNRCVSREQRKLSEGDSSR